MNKIQRIKIGQIGIGHNHAQGKMQSLKKLSELFEIVGVAEDDKDWLDKRKGLACYDGLPWMSEEELLNVEGLQAVTVEKDGFDLIPATVRCAEKGIHIHMDKPGGEDMGAFRKLVDTCKDKGLALQLAYAYRSNPAIQFAVNAVRKGWLGDIFEIHAVMSRYDGNNDEYRRWLAQFKGGAMYIFAGYLIDIIVSMLGKPDAITPFMKQTRDDRLIDNGLAVLEYPRATATIRVSVAEVDGINHRRLIVCGTKGTIEICPLEVPYDRYYTDPQTARLTIQDDVDQYEKGTHIVECGLLGDRYAGQLVELSKIISGAIKNPYSYDHECIVQEALLKSCGIITVHEYFHATMA